ncbi:MAG: hypothetical protein ACI9EF_001829 [Pseudohongiellaceae bacterium]|jgi:hypothetical protein
MVRRSCPRTARHGALVEAQSGERINDLFDPTLWERMGWGLADRGRQEMLSWLLPEVSDPAERRAIALDHQRKCLQRAEQLTRTLDTPARPPAGLSLFLIAGDAHDTPAILSAEPGPDGLQVLSSAPGDLSVLRSSVLLDERAGQPWSPRVVSPIGWSQVLFLFSEHLDLTSDPTFIDNLLYLLLESPTTELGPA